MSYVRQLHCCLAAKGFIYLFIFLCMHLLLNNDKIILGEIDLLGLIFIFNFIIGNFYCWVNFLEFVYFVLDFKSIKKKFMAIKIRKILELQTLFFFYK